MGIKDFISNKAKEKNQYIFANDFFNYLAVTENVSLEAVSNFLNANNFADKVTSYYFDKFDVVHEYEKDSYFNEYFDGNTKTLLNYEFLPFDYYITYKDDEIIKLCHFYYKIEELEKIDFFQDMGLSITTENRQKTYNTLTEYGDNTKQLKRYVTGTFENPCDIQKNLFSRDTLTIDELACLLSADNPISIEKNKHHKDFTKLYEDFIKYRLYVDNCISDNKFNMYFSDQVWNDETLQQALFYDGYILNGFNDWLKVEPAKPLTDNVSVIKHNPPFDTDQQADIKRLTAQLNQANATIAELQKQLAEAQQDAHTPADELTGLDKVNADKALAKKIVSSFAEFIWSMDDGKQIKTGDMADQVRAFMFNFDQFTLPQENKNLKEWFKDIAPEYAKEAGAKPKNAPTTITLTMKL